MGLDGCIVRKGKEADIYEIIEDCKTVAERARLHFVSSSPKLEGERFTTFANIAGTFAGMQEEEQCCVMYLFSHRKWDYLVPGEEEWTKVAHIEGIDDNGKLLLEFLFEYFRLHPEDKIYTGFPWLYTYEDIKRIRQEEFKRNWFCINPHPEAE